MEPIFLRADKKWYTKDSKRCGGALYQPKPRLVDKIAEGLSFA